MSNSFYQIRAYKVSHNYDISPFLESYRVLLQKAIDKIWEKMVWKEEQVGNKKRLIPLIPKENSFKRGLRNFLMENWPYCKHYVDSAIKEAYSILKSWRRNYLRGNRSRKKPEVKKKFVRVKETLYSYKNGKIKICIRPHEEFLLFDISKAWFSGRARGEMGELILSEKFLTVTYKFKRPKAEYKGKIAWDSNEKSIDGFNPELGWIKIDLSRLFHIHRVYELKRQRLQSKASKKPSLRKVLEKYSKREKNRTKDFVHKLTTTIAKTFKGYVHGFENLRKEKMFNKVKKHNRNVAKTDWKTIISLMSYKSEVVYLNPRNSTKRCSRCGMMNASKGALYECGCGLRIDRQLNAAINLYLQMEGLTPSPKLFEELMTAWRGFTLTGEKVDEGFDELGRSLRPMNPKSYVCLLKTT